MDEALRALEQRARGEAPEALRALAAWRERAGDARGAWRARAALARVTDALTDWHALAPPARAPRAPDVVRDLPASEMVVALHRGGLLVLGGAEGLRLVGLDGAERWRCGLDGGGAVVCGPDVLAHTRERLVLLDGASGDVVADAPLRAGARPGRPPGYTRRVEVSADRAVVWHWTGAGEGARTVVDAGERWGEVLAHLPLEGHGWSAEEQAEVAAGRVVGQAPGPRPCVQVCPVTTATAAWTAPDEHVVCADEAGVVTQDVVTQHVAGRRLIVRDLGTGAARWALDLAADDVRLRLAPAHIVALHDLVEVRARDDGRLLWERPLGRRPAAVEAWVVGDALVLFDDSAPGLQALDLASGAERWRLPVAGEAVDDLELRWSVLHAGDGALVMGRFDESRLWGEQRRLLLIQEA
ncbi:MAG: hypothetical protein M9894_36585 [Planctomycetes bacterium]|nr:hypothetical protein [Planctomycetota bacterium]